MICDQNAVRLLDGLGRDTDGTYGMDGRINRELWFIIQICYAI